MCASLESRGYLTFPINTAITKSKEFQISNLLGIITITFFVFNIAFKDRLEAVVQSYNDLPAQADLTITFTSIKPLQLPPPIIASGRVLPGQYSDVFGFMARKKGYLDIRPFQTILHDKACLPLSVAIALYIGEKNLHNTKFQKWYKQCKLPTGVLLLAESIYKMLDQDYNTAVSLDSSTLNKIQSWLSPVKLEVYRMKTGNLKEIIKLYNGNPENFESTIRLLSWPDHVGLIISERLFFSSITWCSICQTAVSINHLPHKYIFCCFLIQNLFYSLSLSL